MPRRHPAPPNAPFDDRATSRRLGTLAIAVCVGSVAALVALQAGKARAQPVGPADGAPLMRAPLQVVAPVDLKRYAGRWHEQARLPNRFQKDCKGVVTADYTLRDDGMVDVKNRCTHDDGTVDEALAEARVIPVAGLPGAGRLEVRFAPRWLSWLPFVWGDYWILKLDRDYQVALVGTPDREYLWVLSREPKLSEAALQSELDYARSLGFEVDRVIRTANPARPAASIGPAPASAASE